MFGEIQRPTHRKRIRNPADDKVDPNFQKLLERRDRVRNAVKEVPAEGETAVEPEKRLTRAERIEKAKEELRHQLAFEATLKDTVVLEGSSAKFICSVTGPDPNFRWFHKGEPLSFTKTCKNNSKMNYGSIILSDITTRDGGPYICEAYNKHCSITSEAYLNVIARKNIGAEPPTFIGAIKGKNLA